MKSKKVTMLAAALVVAVVAAAGIGYAATMYTATTESTDNNAKAAFITVDQGGTGAYATNWLTKVYFDTENTALNTNTYKMIKEWGNTNNVISKQQTGNTLALISEALSLTIKGKNSDDTALTIAVETTDLTAIANLTYKMVLASAITTDQSSGDLTSVTMLDSKDVTSSSTATTWTFTGVTVNNTNLNAEGVTFYVLLFIEGGDSLSTAPGETVGFAADSTFKFTVTADDL